MSQNRSYGLSILVGNAKSYVETKSFLAHQIKLYFYVFFCNQSRIGGAEP